MIKVTSADKWFSLAIRESWDFVCARCRRSFRHDPAKLHCSHVFSRRWASVRHEPINGISLCIGCHRHVGENPIDHAELYRELFGQAQYDLLRELKERIILKRDRPEKEIAKHFKSEYERIRAMRDDGVSGRVELVGW